MERCVLLLQGPSSAFFAHLGAALRARGARVLRVVTCPGDALFAGPGARVHFRGRAADWPGWLAGLMAREGVTDLVLLGDRRPLHAEAVAVAKARGVRISHVELGVLRPDWLTVEPDGGGPACPFPEDWEDVARLAEGAGAPEVGRVWPGSFARMAAMDVAWNLSNWALSWASHPAYRRHAIWHPLAEYGGFLWKFARAGADRRHAARVCAGLAPGFFLFPLQLRTDYQIRAHGPDPDLRVTARAVVDSFAAHAPPGARLLVKEHPMDNALTPWRRLLTAAAGAAGGRVEVIDGGDLEALVRAAAGVVTVNSTVGLQAAVAGRPVKALGRAIWNRDGITDPQPLAGFWAAPRPPDPGRADLFLQALVAATQVRGAFDGPGAAAGAEAVADRVLAPPRLPVQRQSSAVSPT